MFRRPKHTSTLNQFTQQGLLVRAEVAHRFGIVQYFTWPRRPPGVGEFGNRPTILGFPIVSFMSEFRKSTPENARCCSHQHFFEFCLVFPVFGSTSRILYITNHYEKRSCEFPIIFVPSWTTGHLKLNNYMKERFHKH